MIGRGLFIFTSSLTSSVSGLRSLRDIADDQVLVLRTAGKVSSCVSDELVPQYSNQLSKANVRFSILHYGTQDDWENTSSNMVAFRRVRGAQESSSHVFRPRGGLAPWTVFISHQIRSFSIPNPDVSGMNMELIEQGIARKRKGMVEFNVPICYVNWTLAQEAFPIKEVNSSNIRYIHDQNVALWHRYCMQYISPAVNEHDAKFWFVEEDAIFSGNVARFIKAHSTFKDDLVATGLRIAGAHWHKVKNGFWRIGEPYVKKFGNTSNAVRNVDKLPSLSQGRCRDSRGIDTDGFLFFQDHVMRLSTNLLNTLYEYLERGILGPSESWIPTLCASVPSCSIYDFEPQHLNHSIGRNKWLAHSYCWNEELNVSDSCKSATIAGMNGKWFHPYKCKIGHHAHLPKCDF